MKDKNKHEKLTLSAAADKPVIPAGKPGARIVEMKLSAPEMAGDKAHLPLNIALVLDRSGSMHGEKLHYARQAAAHVIDLLGDEDRATVVVYDDQVNLLLPSQSMTHEGKRLAKERIARVQSGGSTFLFGGWMTGCEQLAESLTNQTFNRVLLLTDGLANVGERNVDALAFHAHELFMRGISTSCFGVGQGYDEHLLEAMANHGGGSFHFLETLQAIPLVFEREFDEIINVALHDVEVTLDLPTTVTANVSANWHHTRQDGGLKVFLGSLAAGREQAVYVQLSNLEAKGGSDLTIPLKALGKDHEQRVHEARAELVFAAVDIKEEAAHPQDQELLGRFALVDLADKANEALKLERAGDRAGSAQVMSTAAYLYRDQVNNSTFDRYQQLSEQLSQGLDQDQRKRRHYQEYQSKRGWQSIRDYRLSFDTGKLMADVEGMAVFLNTASPISIAAVPEVLFMNELYKFQHDISGMDCEELSKALGTRVDVMLGMDVLRDLHLRITPQHGVIQLSRRPFRSSGARLPLRGVSGVPTTQFTIGGEEVSLRLVTALKLNYLPGQIAAGLNQVGTASDSLPAGLAFSTPLYELPIALGHHMLPLNFGVAPDALRGSLGLGVGEGVLGTDFLQSAPLTLAFPDGEMIVYV
ncbi:MAG: VWA domain-containing protein [Brevefilum sp.]|nr:VWA domain-containing protein [Brevefilum sp.]